MTSFPHLPTRILKFYTEVLTGFSRGPSPNSFNATFFISRVYPWGSFWEWRGQMERTFQALGRRWVHTGYLILITSSITRRGGVGFWSGVPHPSSISCLTVLPPSGYTYNMHELVEFLKLLDFKRNLFFSRKTQKYRRRHTGSERKEHKFGARK